MDIKTLEKANEIKNEIDLYTSALKHTENDICTTKGVSDKPISVISISILRILNGGETGYSTDNQRKLDFIDANIKPKVVAIIKATLEDAIKDAKKRLEEL